MMPSDKDLTALARDLGEVLLARGARVACVESCTGGWIAKTLTDVPGSSAGPGSSAWFGWGWVTYADDAKRRLVGVPAEMLEAHGAVSEPVVAAMARAGRRLSGAEFAVAVTGIAGPDGGTAQKPVGTVWFAWSGPVTIAERQVFAGDRESIRRQSVAHALRGLLSLVESGAASGVVEAGTP